MPRLAKRQRQREIHELISVDYLVRLSQKSHQRTNAAYQCGSFGTVVVLVSKLRTMP